MGIQGLLKGLQPLLVPPSDNPSSGPVDADIDAGGRRPPSKQRAVRHNVRQFATKTLAVDASSWLHKAAYSCAERLVEAQESNVRDAVAERAYTNYMIRRCEELLNHANVGALWLVFDGKRCPLKSGTNRERERRRNANLEEARRLRARGRTKEAGEKLRACTKATHEMALVVAKAAEAKWGRWSDGVAENGAHVEVESGGVGSNVGTGGVSFPAYGRRGLPRVRCLFSPYEADAQLAKLCVDGNADAVITEDSDLLVYSAVSRNPFPIIYKLDRKDGSCDVITMDWLLNPAFLKETQLPALSDYDDKGFAPIRQRLQSPPADGGRSKAQKRSRRRSDDCLGAVGKNATTPAFLSSLRAFANRESIRPGAGVRLFVQACVLSGCDYAPNRMAGVGPVNAFRLVKEASHREPAARFGRVLRGAKIVPLEEREEEGGGKTADPPSAEERALSTNPHEAPENPANDYEALLAKSEAVFYYHFVKSLADGSVIHLVAPPPKEVAAESETRPEDGSGSASDVGGAERFYPCVQRFDSDLSFVGSPAEAERYREEAAAALNPLNSVPSNKYTNNGMNSKSRFGNPNPDSNDVGWMTAVRRSAPAAIGRRPTVGSVSDVLLAQKKPRETSLQRFLRQPPRPRDEPQRRPMIPTASSDDQGDRRQGHPGEHSDDRTVRDIVRSVACISEAVREATTNASSKYFIRDPMKKNPFALRTSVPDDSRALTMVAADRAGLFDSSRCNARETVQFGSIESASLPMNIDGSSVCKSGDTSAALPSMLSPLARKFDYGEPLSGIDHSSEPALEGSDQRVEKRNTDSFGQDKEEWRGYDNNEASEEAMGAPEMSKISTDGKPGSHVSLSRSTDLLQDADFGDENTFDYAVVPETPPETQPSESSSVLSDDDYEPRAKATTTSKYFSHSEMRTRRSPSRRVTASPDRTGTGTGIAADGRTFDERQSSRNGCSLEKAIELDEEDNGDAVFVPHRKENAIGDNVQHNAPAPIALSISVLKKSSVNKRPFISPYWRTQNKPTARKNPRLTATASSAILAGFVRQTKMLSAGICTDTSKNESWIRSHSPSVGRARTPPAKKRHMRTASLKNFMVPSEILNSKKSTP